MHRRLLSICPNSASCERLFSVFGGILTKWRNRLTTKNLTRLAELKLYVHEEHVHDNAVKNRLKRQHADVAEDKPGSATVAGPIASEATTNWQDNSGSTSGEEPECPGVNDGQTQSASHGIREVVESLIQAVDEEEQNESVETQNPSTGYPPSVQYNRIPLRTLLDYSEPYAESWLGSFYKTAIRCLDDDLELYQLLDLDAEGIVDLDYSNVEDMLAE